MIVLPVLFHPLMRKRGRYERVSLSQGRNKRRHSTTHKCATLL